MRGRGGDLERGSWRDLKRGRGGDWEIGRWGDGACGVRRAVRGMGQRAVGS